MKVICLCIFILDVLKLNMISFFYDEALTCYLRIMGVWELSYA
jgi:hypothetical protein